jgi:hypothetical protein
MDCEKASAIVSRFGSDVARWFCGSGLRRCQPDIFEPSLGCGTIGSEKTGCRGKGSDRAIAGRSDII